MGNCRGLQYIYIIKKKIYIFENKYSQLNNHINKYFIIPVAYLHTLDDAIAAILSSAIL